MKYIGLLKYGWIYYLEDLQKEYQYSLDLRGGRKNVENILCRLKYAEHNELLLGVQQIFRQYHDTTEAREAVEHIMSIHAKLANDNEVIKSIHNAAVYAYMMEIDLNTKQIGQRLNVSSGTAYNNIKKAFENIAAIISGILFLQKPYGYADGITEILHNYKILQVSQMVDSEKLTGALKEWCIKGQEATKHALKGLELLLRLFEIYSADTEKYCDEADPRKLQVLKLRYLEDKKALGAAAGVEQSREQTYTDSRDIITKLADLAEFIAYEADPEAVG